MWPTASRTSSDCVNKMNTIDLWLHLLTYLQLSSFWSHDCRARQLFVLRRVGQNKWRNRRQCSTIYNRFDWTITVLYCFVIICQLDAALADKCPSLTNTQVSIAYYVFGSRWHVVRWRDRWGTKAELSGSLGQLGKDAVRMSLATRHNVQHITECLLFVVVAIQFSLSLAQRLKRDILFDLPLFRRTRPLVCPFHVRWKP